MHAGHHTEVRRRARSSWTQEWSIAALLRPIGRFFFRVTRVSRNVRFRPWVVGTLKRQLEQVHRETFLIGAGASESLVDPGFG